MKTKKQIRQAFKEICPEYKPSKLHNEQTSTVRSQFTFYIDSLRRDNVISEKLANETTL